MIVSARSYLAAGVSAMLVGAVALAPVQPSAPTSITADTVRLSAAVQPLVNQVNSAAAVLGQSDPVATAQSPRPQASATANNNVSNAIDAAYGVIMYWGDYWANQLGPYLLGWVPFGYLISDQIQIWYNSFTVPVSYSFVYDFLDPVVNDFWNPAVWSAGLTALAQTTFSSLGATVNQEIAYFWSLQWFPIPLPPLPPLPFAATTTAAASATDATAARQAKTADSTVTSGTGHSARPHMATQAQDTTDTTVRAEAVTGTVDTATPSTASASKTATATKTITDGSAGTPSSKGDSAKSTNDTGEKKSTAGSARSHAPKAAKRGGA